MELKDGYYNGMICSVKPIKSRFGQQGVMELYFECGYYDEANKPAGKCEIYLELSGRYGMGNDSQKTWWQITKEKLNKLGWQGDLDLTKLGQLVNKPCRMSYSTVDKDGKPHKNGPKWNFSFRKEVEEIDPASANAMLAQMMGGGMPAAPAPAAAPATAFAFNAAAPAAAPAAPAAAAAPNPFAGM